MAITFQEDEDNAQTVLDQIDESLSQAKQSSAARTLLYMREGEQYLVRLLNPASRIVMLDFHERFTNQKPDPRAVCGHNFELECAWCAEQKTSGDFKLKPDQHFFLQLYLHAVYKRGADKAMEQVTYKDNDGVTKAVGGIRLLEMKRRGPLSGLLAIIKEAYADDPQVLAKDYVIKKIGSGPNTNYTFSAQQRVRPLPPTIEVWTRKQIMEQVVEACPVKTVGSVLDAVADIQLDDVTEGDEFP